MPSFYDLGMLVGGEKHGTKFPMPPGHPWRIVIPRTEHHRVWFGPELPPDGIEWYQRDMYLRQRMVNRDSTMVIEFYAREDFSPAAASRQAWELLLETHLRPVSFQPIGG